MGLAIGRGGSRAASGAGGEASVDAIAVVIADDEHAPLGLRGMGEGEAQDGGETDQETTHGSGRFLESAQNGRR